jgi:hypothetical protein
VSGKWREIGGASSEQGELALLDQAQIERIHELQRMSLRNVR